MAFSNVTKQQDQIIRMSLGVEKPQYLCNTECIIKITKEFKYFHFKQ